jgi:hypothetical protein
MRCLRRLLQAPLAVQRQLQLTQEVSAALRAHDAQRIATLSRTTTSSQPPMCRAGTTSHSSQVWVHLWPQLPQSVALATRAETSRALSAIMRCRCRLLQALLATVQRKVQLTQVAAGSAAQHARNAQHSATLSHALPSSQPPVRHACGATSCRSQVPLHLWPQSPQSVALHPMAWRASRVHLRPMRPSHMQTKAPALLAHNTLVASTDSLLALASLATHRSACRVICQRLLTPKLHVSNTLATCSPMTLQCIRFETFAGSVTSAQLQRASHVTPTWRTVAAKHTQFTWAAHTCLLLRLLMRQSARLKPLQARTVHAACALGSINQWPQSTRPWKIRVQF